MKKLFFVLILASLGISAMGFQNCINMIRAGGAGTAETWIFGLAPFLGGFVIGNILVWLYGHTKEIVCKNCGGRQLLFSRSKDFRIRDLQCGCGSYL